MPLEKELMPEYQKKLKDACTWLGIQQGRATQYVRLLDESGQERQSGEQIMSYYESHEIVKLYELWRERVGAFPGLKDKIRRACQKGQVFSDDERENSSNNRSRNDAFGFLVAGNFLAAGIPVVSVDGMAAGDFTCQSNADFTFRWEDIYINVECKRLQSEPQLLKRAKEAEKQITRSGRCGIIAMDCSDLCRPAGHLLDNSDPVDAEFWLSKRLETDIGPEVLRSLSPAILGFILFVRIPAMTYTGTILRPSGERFQRRDVILSWLIIADPKHKNFEILRSICSMLNAQHLE